MSLFAAEATLKQALLLKVVYRGREIAGCPNYRLPGGVPCRVGRLGIWPYFQYVEAVLAREHGLDATAILAELPRVAIAGTTATYGWATLRDANVLRPDDKVELTVAGMARLPKVSDEVLVFLDVLALFVEREAAVAPSPIELQHAEVSALELQHHLARSWMLGDAELQTIQQTLEREPATWACQLQPPESPSWTATLSPFLRRYDGIRTPD